MMLQEGNVIKLQEGMEVYGLIPKKFVYANRKLSNELTRNEIVIGKKYVITVIDLEKEIENITKDVIEKLSSRGVDIDKSKIFDFVKENIPKQHNEEFVLNEGEYVVVKTMMSGGSYTHGLHDGYPDGYRVFCKKLKDGEYDENGIEIDFYQSRSFSCIIKDITPIRDLKRAFI